MILLDFDNFKTYCESKVCLRKSFKSKNCFKFYKQEKCYKKYLKYFEDSQKFCYSKAIEFRDKIVKRDKTCRVWNILTNEEKKIILDDLYDEYIILENKLDICHAISRARAPQLKYKEDNVFLASRFFHILLDTGKDLITCKSISEEETKTWITRIMSENKIWNKNETYDSYYQKKI